MNILDDSAYPTFTVAGDVLFDFAAALPEPAHVKSTEDGRYLFSNQRNLEIYGVSRPEEIVGATVHDLDGFMRPFWGQRFAQGIGQLDDRVIQRRAMVTDQHRVFLDTAGLLHIQDMTKLPVLNNSSRVAAILTLSVDHTHQTDVFALLDLYKQAYTKKAEAMIYFTRHLHLETFFQDALTEQEARCLLYMQRNRYHKSIAQAMAVGLKTVETHVSHLIRKSVHGNLSKCLVFLRRHGHGSAR